MPPVAPRPHAQVLYSAAADCGRPLPGPAWCLRPMPELDLAKLAQRARRDAAKAPLATDASHLFRWW